MAAMLQNRALHSSNMICRISSKPLPVAALLARTSGHLHVVAAAAAAPRQCQRVNGSKTKSKSLRSTATLTGWRQPADYSWSLYGALSTLAASGTSRMQPFRGLWPDVCRLFPELQSLEMLNLSSNRGAMNLEESLQLLEEFFVNIQDFLQNAMPAECRGLHTHCRWLGNIPELLEAAELHGGKMTTTEVRDWIKEQPTGVLQRLGLTKDLAGLEIDHFFPECKLGRNHPINYILMDASTNRSFGGEFSLRKCLYVGLPVALEIIGFMWKELLLERAAAGTLSVDVSDTAVVQLHLAAGAAVGADGQFM